MTSKTIYTSNYARISQFSKEHKDCHIIATSIWVPHWFAGKVHEKREDLMPTWEMVRAIKDGKMTTDKYETQYLNLLKERKVSANKLIKELPNDTFLLCFESPTDFCHRHTLANWVYEHTGVELVEWKTKREREKARKQDNLESLIEL